MPPEAESRDPSEWFRKAHQDLQRVPRCLEAGDCEDAAFHLQQAVEKALKGFLIARGWTLRRTHNLSFLLDEAVQYLASLEAYRPLCQEASAFYFEERYPFIEEAPDRAEVESLFRLAQQLIEQLSRQ